MAAVGAARCLECDAQCEANAGRTRRSRRGQSGSNPVHCAIARIVSRVRAAGPLRGLPVPLGGLPCGSTATAVLHAGSARGPRTTAAPLTGAGRPPRCACACRGNEERARAAGWARQADALGLRRSGRRGAGRCLRRAAPATTCRALPPGESRAPRCGAPIPHSNQTSTTTRYDTERAVEDRRATGAQ